MAVILAPDGSLADRVIQPMTQDQIQWFLDPVEFLNGVPHLWTLKLRVYCQRCWKKGLRDTVRVAWDESSGEWDVRCQCARVPGRLRLQDVLQYASSTDEFLSRVGWSLCCTGRCSTEQGIGDGVEAGNDPNAQTLSVRCGCTDRRYTRADPTCAAA